MDFNVFLSISWKIDRMYPFLTNKVVSASRLVGVDHPLEIVYFVEAPSGQRMPAVQAANLLNSVDVQRAAIILGYRVQGILAQRKYIWKSGLVGNL